MEYFRKSPLKPEDIGGLFNQENVKDKSSHDLVDIIAKNRELLEEIENLETDQETKKLIIGRVFEHSTSDGLQLAERSNFTNKDYFDVIKNPKFYLKHKALAKQIIQEAKFSAQSEADKEAVAELEAIYKKYDEDLAAGNDQIFLKTEKIQDHKVKTLLNKVDNWYSQFLKAKNIAPVSAEIDPRSPGEILGEDALEQIQLALEKNYYPTDVMRLVVKYLAQTQEKSLTKQARDIFRSDKLLQEKYKFKGFDDYLENIKKGKESVRQIALENLRKILNPEEMHKLEFGDYLPEIIIQKIIDKYKIDDDKILKQFTEARYKPLSITFKIQTQEAEKKIIQEINAKGKQIIWDEKLNKFIVEAGDVEQKETKFLTEEKILNELERLLKEGADKDFVAEGLAGLDSPQAWAMRERLLKEGVGKGSVARGLAGLDSPQAWAMRERLLKEGARKDYVALGLAGLDSPQAWAMRERLLEEGAGEGSVALGLAGLDSPQAWAMRERLLKEGAGEGSVAIGLAGLDSPQAWAMRERLLKEGVGKGSVALGLAGLDSPQAWAMRERLLKEGAGEGSVAIGLAGLDSPQAWAMRERLLKEGVGKGSVARGLAGLDSPQAWAMRERLLKEGARKDYVALGLAGLDSPQAWAMRERLLEEGAYKGSVAIGLAGLDSPQAWAMRERLLEEGAYKGLVAQGLAGLDSPQAWAMRERLLEEGAGNGSVAQGLAGLDSPQAWQMRERLLKEGADKDYVAVGLAGLDSPQAWAMRERLLKEGADKGYVALGLAGYYITFVWQLKNKPTEQAVIEQKISRAAAQEFDENKLRIEINNYLSQSSLLAQERNLSLKQKLRKGISQSKSVAKILSEMVKHSPEAFINTMAAKKDKRQTAKKLAGKTFPSILWSRPDNNWRSWEGYSGFDFSSDSRKEEAEPEDYLSPRSLEMMLGGNPEGLSKEGKDKEVMRFREPINGLLVTGIYGRLSGNNWDSSYQFAVDKKVMEKAKETTITLPQVGKKSKLPKLLNTEIIPERVKGIKKGEEIPLAVDISPMREATVNDTKGCRELVYSVESDEVPSVMREISNEEYIRFKEKFIKENGSEAIQPIAELPEEIDLFLQQIKNKSPKEQVQAIEEFVRSISYYDEKNGEMINLKINKSLDERLAIMQARVDELKAKNPKDKEILQNKMYAGVCADFAVLAAAILRRAGFVSGVLAGFYAQGTSVKLSNAHGTAFVVWPNQKGGNEIFAVDGTPEGLEGISAPSLVEIEKIREEKIAEIKQEAMEKLDEIMEILASHDEESIKKLTNGELEKVLNTVLRYDVKQENLQAINTMLEVYWYSPIHKLDLTEVDDKIKILKFFESEINRIRESQAEPVIDPGSKLFETVEAFTQRFSRGEDIQKGLDIIDNIASLVGNRLKQSERKALAVITTYLRAKKIKGDGN